MGMGMLKAFELHAPVGVKDSDLYGWVIDNDDSKSKDGKKLGRVRVRIPQLHRGIPDKDIPWAMAMNESAPHAGTGVGALDIPSKGSKVRVKMDKNDPHVIRYGGGIPTEDVVKENELRNDPDYPWVSGHVDEGGNRMRINNKEGKTEYEYTHVSGTQYRIDNDGNLYLNSAGVVYIGGKKGVEIASDNYIKIHSKGAFSMKGKNILQNGGDGAVSMKEVKPRKRPKIDEKQNRVDL